MSDSVRPHRRQPTRLHRPWDSPGKNTEVGCHFLLQCMKVKSEREVAQSCSTPNHPMDCSLPGSSVPGIFQARVLKCVAIAFSEISYTNTYILNLERWYQRIYLQGSSGETDIENRLMDTGERGGEGEMYAESNMETYITIRKIDSQ